MEQTSVNMANGVSCGDSDSFENVGTPVSVPVVSSMREFANRVQSYVLGALDWGMKRGDTNYETWKMIACYLALYNIQLIIKHKIETGKDGIKRYTFFVTRGRPREMISFKLSAEAADGYLALPADFRLLIMRSFDENKNMMIYPYACSLDTFGIDGHESLGDVPIGTEAALTICKRLDEKKE